MAVGKIRSCTVQQQLIVCGFCSSEKGINRKTTEDQRKKLIFLFTKNLGILIYQIKSKKHWTFSDKRCNKKHQTLR